VGVLLQTRQRTAPPDIDSAIGAIASPDRFHADYRHRRRRRRPGLRSKWRSSAGARIGVEQTFDAIAVPFKAQSNSRHEIQIVERENTAPQQRRLDQFSASGSSPGVSCAGTQPTYMGHTLTLIFTILLFPRHFEEEDLKGKMNQMKKGGRKADGGARLRWHMNRSSRKADDRARPKARRCPRAQRRSAGERKRAGSRRGGESDGEHRSAVESKMRAAWQVESWKCGSA